MHLFGDSSCEPNGLGSKLAWFPENQDLARRFRTLDRPRTLDQAESKALNAAYRFAGGASHGAIQIRLCHRKTPHEKEKAAPQRCGRQPSTRIHYQRTESTKR
jgi:hypothetical protein